ncbi:MAG: L,D-transpeptidase [Xanthobacteraceae bacterium]
MRRRSLSWLQVRTRPGSRTHGILLAGARAIPVLLGRSGIRANKLEGDGATPRGTFRLVRAWWRADRHPRPETQLPVRRITADLAWCENTGSAKYNRPFRRSASEPGDRLWREDPLYDFFIQLDHNTRPRVGNRGSAVFIHLARSSGAPTAGCIALGGRDLQRLLQVLGPHTRIRISG